MRRARVKRKKMLLEKTALFLKSPLFLHLNTFSMYDTILHFLFPCLKSCTLTTIVAISTPQNITTTTPLTTSNENAWF